MSNTAYQRSMQDMRAAGLNPMLAAMKGGASSPSGAMANSSAAPTMQNPYSAFANSALDMARTVAEINNIRANTRQVEAKTPKYRVEGRVYDIGERLVENALKHAKSNVSNTGKGMQRERKNYEWPIPSHDPAAYGLGF